MNEGAFGGMEVNPRASFHACRNNHLQSTLETLGKVVFDKMGNQPLD